MKTLAITIILLLMSAYGITVDDLSEKTLGASFETKKEQILETIENQENLYKSSHPKFQYMSKKSLNGTGYSYKVHEYQTSKNEVGYQVLFYDEQDRVVESKGYGVEADSRTWITNYTDPIITPTST